MVDIICCGVKCVACELLGESVRKHGVKLMAQYLGILDKTLHSPNSIEPLYSSWSCQHTSICTVACPDQGSWLEYLASKHSHCVHFHYKNWHALAISCSYRLYLRYSYLSAIATSFRALCICVFERAEEALQRLPRNLGL